jgi:hypothetical protein
MLSHSTKPRRTRLVCSAMFIIPLATCSCSGTQAPGAELASTKRPVPLKISLESYANNLPQFHTDFEDPNNWLDEAGNAETKYTQGIPPEIVGGFNCTLQDSVRVTPARNVKYIRHRKDADPQSTPSSLDDGYGFIVAKVTSTTSNCRTIPLRINYGTFYWVIRRDPQTNRPQSVIVNGSTAEIVQRVSLHRCDNFEDAHAHDAVAFFSATDVCDPNTTHPVSKDPRALTAYYVKVRDRSGPDLPFGGAFDLWFTCDQGCCYADF